MGLMSQKSRKLLVYSKLHTFVQLASISAVVSFDEVSNQKKVPDIWRVINSIVLKHGYNLCMTEVL